MDASRAAISPFRTTAIGWRTERSRFGVCEPTRSTIHRQVREGRADREEIIRKYSSRPLRASRSSRSSSESRGLVSYERRAAVSRGAKSLRLAPRNNRPDVAKRDEEQQRAE